MRQSSSTPDKRKETNGRFGYETQEYDKRSYLCIPSQCLSRLGSAFIIYISIGYENVLSDASQQRIIAICK